MKTYLELEGKLGPKPRPQPQIQSQPCTNTPPQNNNPLARKAPGPKMNEKKKRTRVPAKRRYKVRVIVQPLPTAPSTSAPVHPIPTSTVATSNASTQMSVGELAATSILVMVYNLAQGKFKRIPYPAERSQKNPSVPSCNTTQLEATPSAPTFQVREDTLWPNTVSASINLYKARADWPIPPMPAPTVKAEKTEVLPQVSAIPHAMVLPKQNNRSIEEKCTWGPHCPICKN